MRRLFYLWIKYLRRRWYWPFLCLFYKLGEDVILNGINSHWGIAMSYLNYIPPTTGYFLIPLIFSILVFKTYRQVSRQIEHDRVIQKAQLLSISTDEAISRKLDVPAKSEIQPKQSQTETEKAEGDKVRIEAEIKADEIIGWFWNDTAMNLQCDIWIARFQEWSPHVGYLDDSDFKSTRIVRTARIKRQNRYDTYTKLIYRDRHRKHMCIRGFVGGTLDREQPFSTLYPENIWCMEIEAKTDSETIGKKNLFFRFSPDKGFELGEDPKIKRPS